MTRSGVAWGPSGGSCPLPFAFLSHAPCGPSATPRPGPGRHPAGPAPAGTRALPGTVRPPPPRGSARCTLFGPRSRPQRGRLTQTARSTPPVGVPSCRTDLCPGCFTTRIRRVGCLSWLSGFFLELAEGQALALGPLSRPPAMGGEGEGEAGTGASRAPSAGPARRQRPTRGRHSAPPTAGGARDRGPPRTGQRTQTMPPLSPRHFPSPHDTANVPPEGLPPLLFF